MGAICGGSDEKGSNAVNDKLMVRQGLVVYGDWFDSDTRTVMTLLKLANVSHTFKPVD